MAKNASENKLLKKHGWRSFRKYGNENKNINILMKQVNLNAKSFPRKVTYKFGVKIPRNYKEALNFDEENNNKLLGEAIERELNQLLEYKTFDNKGIDFKPPDGYKKLPVKLVFDCKNGFKKKAILVPGGHRI